MREVKSKVSVGEMSEIMTALSNCVPGSLLPDRTVVHDPEDSELKRTLDNTTFHFAALGNAVGQLHEFQIDTTYRLGEMDDAIADRPTKDKVKKKVKKETKKAKHKAYKKIDALNDKIKEVENYMHDKFKEVEKVHKEFEANINWKVDECTGLLKVRVTEQFVWDAIRTIEERMRKDIKTITENEMGKFDKTLKQI
jgi:hypothetical protein